MSSLPSLNPSELPEAFTQAHPESWRIFEGLAQDKFFSVEFWLRSSTAEAIAQLIDKYPHLDQKDVDSIQIMETTGIEAGLVLPQITVRYQEQLIGYGALKTIW